ncbi:HEAT repeat domain-containing protein [Nafulsella turpanensis]|uniref:HEAT repeat domain-containing protein n=1 Tax=Nafulsella turpanensis TaxID=1265690 RepID=UPI0003743F4A|nr:HEAT repeat domain-containing protein [Nafulsella turpanensis]
MMDEKYMPLALDYIEGRLSEQEKEELAGLIAAGAIDQRELDELALFYGKLPEELVEVPSEKMRNRFYTTLAAEQAKQVKAARPGIWKQLSRWWQVQSFQPNPQWAYAVILLLLGIGIGYQLRPVEPYKEQLSSLSQEVQQMREVVILSMLEQQSPTERLKAVNMGYDLPQADARVIDALLHTLNNDPNVNVRLAAVEALRQHAAQSAVRQGLIQSINQQNSPMVQIALADLMVELQEKEAVEPMKQLLEEPSVNEAVKEKLQKSIHVLI